MRNMIRLGINDLYVRNDLIASALVSLLKLPARQRGGKVWMIHDSFG